MNREQFLRQMTSILLVALFVASVSACALQDLWGRLALKPAAPGKWIASAESGVPL